MKFLEALHQHNTVINNLASELSKLSENFLAVGNPQVARQLNSIHLSMSEELQELKAAYDEDLVELLGGSKSKTQVKQPLDNSGKVW